MGLLDKYLANGEEVKFISRTLQQYREVRKVYAYDYEPEDLKALQACAKDLRPFTWSLVPALATWFTSGRLIKTKGTGASLRAAVAIARVFATGQVFRMGYLAGSYRQTTSCMKGMVALPTPLGGEIVALIRGQNPEHPYLKYERRPPGFEYNDAERPRISTEANRLAQIERFRKQLADAKAGQAVQRGDGEVLEGLMEQRSESIDHILHAKEEFEAKRRQRMSGGSKASAGGSFNGLDATEEQAWGAATQQQQPVQQQGSAAGTEEGGGGDIFDVVGAGMGWGDEAESEEGVRKQEQQERRERRRDRWGRLRRQQPDADKQAGESAMEGSD